MTLIDGVYTDLERPLLYIHILAGFVSLGTAYLLLFLKKVISVTKSMECITSMVCQLFL